MQPAPALATPTHVLTCTARLSTRTLVCTNAISQRGLASHAALASCSHTLPPSLAGYRWITARRVSVHGITGVRAPKRAVRLVALSKRWLPPHPPSSQLLADIPGNAVRGRGEVRLALSVGGGAGVRVVVS